MTGRFASLAAAAALSGCGLFGAAPASGRPVSEAYGSGPTLRVLDADPPLRAERRVPVLSVPEVFAAYVPSHPRGDLLIGEHWIFFKLKEAEWFVERLQDPEPPASGDAPPAHLGPLRDLDWTRAVVPYRSSP
jgi:hypothetical protein